MLTWLAQVVSSSTATLLAAMFLLTFLAYMVLLKGAHPFMVAWCLLYWFMLAPLFMSGIGLGDVVYGHVVGVGVVIALNVLKPLWAGRRPAAISEPDPAASIESPEPTADQAYSRGYVTQYSAIVATAVTAGVGMGTQWMSADPTVIANATLNVISPTFKQVWHSAVERAVLGCSGIILGFYLGWFLPGAIVGQAVTAVCAFATLATARISFGVVIFFLFVLIAYPWGVMHSDLGHHIANEKLIGELVGVAIAVAAIGALARLDRSPSP